MNRIFIEQFELLLKQIKAEFLNAQIENDLKEMKMHEYRLKNIKNILGILKKLDFEIKQPDDLKGIPGIGKGTLLRIKEIIDTGKLAEIQSKYSDSKQKKISGIQELTKVIGIGDKLAKKIVTQYKITSVDELKDDHKKGKIELSDKILLGLKYYGIVQGDIPRKEISQIEKFIKKELEEIDEDVEMTICGSYRRGKITSGDIDVLIYHSKLKNSKDIRKSPYLEDLVEKLSEDNFIIDHITDKNYKVVYRGFCKYKNNPVRRIDIKFVPYDGLYAALLHFTGPMELNTIMREKAKKRNMILNEYGLFEKNNNSDIDSETDSETDDKNLLKRIKVKSEEDIFKKLGMKYLSPSERENYSVGKNK